MHAKCMLWIFTNKFEYGVFWMGKIHFMIKCCIRAGVFSSIKTKCSVSKVGDPSFIFVNGVTVTRFQWEVQLTPIKDSYWV